MLYDKNNKVIFVLKEGPHGVLVSLHRQNLKYI